ncbi:MULTISPECIES: hypothetical protein [Haloarcula]|uniref:Uncharacterized protein n=1 Tax=Haloarcula pellucida TaxID=1427151 RepID=A0A830GSN3_9EURY|nr:MULTISPECIES: hypothetical protein [Halomicroarcula]MBX0349272.1 hypothetical protein [Halomicroarcula pellucida]MDS0279142.1 hypothetical protein [Halomicroarcula sp. S1AR25-4]GGN99809.1 hypothetical protein GCM10009030_31780 [Halomicroarcula pellucida]
MERGTDRERAAVRDRWEAMERQRTLTTDLLAGLSLVAAGAIVLGLAAARSVCETSLRGHVLGCTPLAGSESALLLVAVGVAALVAGLCRFWRVTRT